MKLSLSVRIAESFHDKRKADLSLDEIIELAREFGFEALCMRASQAGVQTLRDELETKAERIRAAGLAVSMVTGDFAVPQNDEHGPDGLRNITPYLDLAEAFGADLIRICMKTEADIDAARGASDEALERGIRLAHQSHFASLFETVDESLRVLRAVNRPNFGLIYEPANWMIGRQDYVGAIAKLRPWIFNVYVQNHRVVSPVDGDDTLQTWTQGTVGLRHIGVWDVDGVEYDRVFEALRTMRYDGWVTVHQAFAGVMPLREAVELSIAYLRGRL